MAGSNDASECYIKRFKYYMATVIIMPKQGQSVETCIITKWFRKKGERVSTGDILFSYETDKAAFDLEAPADGILLETFYDEGAEVPVLTNVAVIGEVGEQSAVYASAGQAIISAPETTHEEQSAQAQAPSYAENVTNVTNRIRISPRARNFAEKHGIDFSSLRGSGPNGRIICADVEKVQSTEIVTDRTEFTEQALTNIRRIIAKAMHSSLQNSAQLTHHMSADVRNILAARNKIKAEKNTGKSVADITINDMICWCVIRALEKFPVVNSHFLENSIRTFNAVHLGMAVDTPRGLMVPALKNADRLSLSELSSELKSLADSCRKGSIDPELIKSTSATFTVSNLGNYGVEIFTPVINLPQSGILGVCAIINRPADLGNNTFGFVPYIGLSLTYDHRSVDGGPATLFLRVIREQIEKFSL